MLKNWTFTKTDEKIARRLQAFLPDRLFDIHAHLYRRADMDPSSATVIAEGPDEVTTQTWRELVQRQVGSSRLVGGLFMPLPVGDRVDQWHQYLLAQLNNEPDSKGLIVASPNISRDKVTAWLENPNVVGFRAHHTLSLRTPAGEAPLASYLPEWYWQLANERGLLIMLHLARDQALADPDNQREIREMCTRYPHVKLILAHAAGGFHAPNTVKGLPAIRGLDNVWFDTSGVCESQSIVAILNEFGPRRLIWGSDFPVSEEHARAVTVGDGFVWLYPDVVRRDTNEPRCQPIQIGLESLRATQEAAEIFGLNHQDLRDIFHDNAIRLLAPKGQAGTVAHDQYEHTKHRIPGGTQLLSKRPERWAPGQWPAYFREARGCETWDLDGRHYYDMASSGIGSCLLGFRDPDVTRAVRRRINLGSMCTLNPPEELELADLLCEKHPWAQQARFARTGGEIAAIAVRIARATTDRSLIAVCGYHGWTDWYLAANLGDHDGLRGHLFPGLKPFGVPTELRGTTFPFNYNDRDAFQDIVDKHGDRLAAVVMEPCRFHDPEPGFLEFVRNTAHRCGALLIYDEITIGWRLTYGGAHLKYGIEPDMAFFAKAMGNGHPIAAVIGTEQAMEGAQESFISSTYWTESVGPAAALAVIRKLEQVKIVDHIARVGTIVADQWQRSAKKYRLPVVAGDGFPCLAHFRFEHEESEALRTLYTQLMLERGFLAGVAIYPTLAHTDETIALYRHAIDEVYSRIADAIASGDIKSHLKGPPAYTDFRRLL